MKAKASENAGVGEEACPTKRNKSVVNDSADKEGYHGHECNAVEEGRNSVGARMLLFDINSGVNSMECQEGQKQIFEEINGMSPAG